MSMTVSAQLPAKVDNLSDFRLMVQNPKVSPIIAAKEEAYYTINIAEAMQSLAQVGSLLQVAYAASKGHGCSESVIKILGNYQTLVHDSNVVSGAFVEGCVSSVQSHILARDIAQEGEFECAVEMLSECKAIAGKMVKISGDLVNKSTILVDLSQTSLEEATREESVGVENRKRIMTKIEEQKALRAKMETTSLQLQNAVEDAKQKEQELASKLDTERERQFAINMIGAIMTPVSSAVSAMGGPKLNLSQTSEEKSEQKSDTSTIAALAESERQAAAERSKLQGQYRESNASLTESVERLKGLGFETDRVNQAVQSLETVVITMGKVKTTFERTRQFWLGVQKHCEALEEGGTVAKLAKFAGKSESMKARFIEAISASGFNWAALGKINLVAHETIIAVTDGVDKIMSNLPSESEVPKLLQAVSTDLLEQLKTERKALN